LDRVNGFKILSKLDLKKRYHECPIAPSHRGKTSFKWMGKVYQFAGAPFGISHLTHHFQALMEVVLAEHAQYCMVFIDDIIIFSRTPEEHAKHCAAIILSLNAANLKLNIAKCMFGHTELLVLGHKVGADGAVTADASKVWKLLGTHRPQTKAQLQSFLGFVNYLLRFIPFAHNFTGPLQQLQKLGPKISNEQWLPVHQKAFEALQDILSHAVMLQKPLPDVKFQIATDASLYGVGAMLFQETVHEGKVTRRYIELASMAFAKHQRNYSATKRELLALVFGIRKFHAYLFGQKFQVWTDHRALIYLHGAKPCYMIQDWLATLLEYSFSVGFLPGVENVVPDYLSRLYEPQEQLSSRLCALRRANLAVQELTAKPEAELKQFIRDRLDKIFVPADKQKAILRSTHEDHGHFGAEALFKSLFIDKNMFWPGMRRQCKDCVSKCLPCLRFNVGKTGFHLSRPRKISEIFQSWSIDLAEFPTSAEGHNFVLLAVDMASGFTALTALKDKTKASVGRALYTLFGTFGFPRELQSDNGAEFVNQLIAAVRKVALIEGRRTAPFNPRANGAAEARVKTAKMILTKTLSGDFRNWQTRLPMVQLAINTRPLNRTGTSPYTLVFSRSSPLMQNDDPANPLPRPMTPQEIICRQERIRQIVHPLLFSKSAKAQQLSASQFDAKRHRPSRKFRPGAAVMVRRSGLNKQNAKTEPKYDGPYLIFEITEADTCRLAHLDGTSAGKPITVDKLKLVDSHFWRSITRGDYFEVEAIVGHRLNAKRDQLEYLVKWKGYPASQNEWVLEQNMAAAPVIQAYWNVLQVKDPAAARVRTKFAGRKRPRLDIIVEKAMANADSVVQRDRAVPGEAFAASQKRGKADGRARIAEESPPRTSKRRKLSDTVDLTTKTRRDKEPAARHVDQKAKRRVSFAFEPQEARPATRQAGRQAGKLRSSSRLSSKQARRP